jgi:hypothetical protein
MSTVSYSANLELALYPTTLRISAVSDSTDLESAPYQKALNHEFLPSHTNISANSKPNILVCESGAHMGSIHEKTEVKNLVLLSL